MNGAPLLVVDSKGDSTDVFFRQTRERVQNPLVQKLSTPEWLSACKNINPGDQRWKMLLKFGIGGCALLSVCSKDAVGKKRAYMPNLHRASLSVLSVARAA